MSTVSKIKEKCPEDITYENIKVVLTYLQLREHLHLLAIPYREFEDFNYEDVNKVPDPLLSQTGALDQLLDMAANISKIDKELENTKANDSLIETDLMNASSSPARKKQKIHDTGFDEDDDLFAILDSP